MTTEVHVQIDPLAGMTTCCHCLLLTNAGGNLGRTLHEHLSKYADSLRLSNVSNLDEACTDEEVVPYNLADTRAVDAFVVGTDAVVHPGDTSVERPFEETLPINTADTYNLYETTRRHGVRRVVSTSSDRTVGFYKQGEAIDSAAPTRPSGYYKLSKVFGEQLASFYFDRYGIRTVTIRVGFSFTETKDRCMLVTWLGYGDLEQLIRRTLFVPNMGFTVVYGMSNNRDRWRDNHHAMHPSYTPTQTSEIFRAQVEAQSPLPADDLAAQYRGDTFVRVDPLGD